MIPKRFKPIPLIPRNVPVDNQKKQNQAAKSLMFMIIALEMALIEHKDILDFRWQSGRINNKLNSAHIALTEASQEIQAKNFPGIDTELPEVVALGLHDLMSNAILLEEAEVKEVNQLIINLLETRLHNDLQRETTVRGAEEEAGKP